MKNSLTISCQADRQSGMALMIALWLLAIGTLMGCTWYMECLFAARMSDNRSSRQMAFAMAHTGISIATSLITAVMAANPQLLPGSLFTGADGILGPCFPAPASIHDPVDPSMAWITPLGQLANACGDDGTVIPVGAGGIDVFRNHGILEYCLSAPCSEGSRIGHIWVKISDNPESDNDAATDQDSIMILRAIAAAENGTDVIRRDESVRNSIVVLEAWLRRETDGMITILSLRELTR